MVPKFASSNTVFLELRTLRLRAFGDLVDQEQPPTLVLAPYAGHTAMIADLMRDQSLVQTLLCGGVESVFVTDWKSATADMQDFDIDNYLGELNVAVGDLGDRVNLVGLCQGGWLAAMYAARYPEKVACMVLAGSPIDTDVGRGPIRTGAHALPMAEYDGPHRSACFSLPVSQVASVTAAPPVRKAGQGGTSGTETPAIGVIP